VSRYRAPTQPGSKYITPNGARRLQEELDQLWHEERPRVTQAVSEAAAQGDRSENAEYTYGKKRLHEIDRRVRFLRKRLEGMAIVDPTASPGRRDANRVFFGAWVQIETAAGDLRWYRIVGPDEFDMHEDYISMDSPLGKGLLGKRLDDELNIELPAGATTLTVVAISYATSSPGRS
jgi:transcription elongation factor GreB